MTKRTARLAAWSIALAGFLAACDNVVDPQLPRGATHFTPPAVYTIWWEMTKACSGRSGSLDAVTWYQFPANVLAVDGKPVSAYWSGASNQIVLSASVIDNGQVVRHEMLHSLLATKGHSRAEFLERCAGYVTCTTQCIEDAGPVPVVPAWVPRVISSALEVTMVLAPTPPFSSVNDGYFSLTVRARNPAPNQVFVELPTSGQSQVAFSYRIFGPTGESDYVPLRDNGLASFAAGETKVHVFDFFVDNQGTRLGHIYPGQYLISGAYGSQAAPTQSFQAR